MSTCTGRPRPQLGRYPAGTPYSAGDPDLMLWVHATLVQCSLAVYTRFVEPLSAHEREEYHRQMRTVGRVFGVPDAVLPRSLAEFREYFRGEVEGASIAVTDPGPVGRRGDPRPPPAAADAALRPRPSHGQRGAPAAAAAPRVRAALEPRARTGASRGRPRHAAGCGSRRAGDCVPRDEPSAGAGGAVLLVRLAATGQDARHRDVLGWRDRQTVGVLDHHLVGDVLAVEGPTRRQPLRSVIVSL